MYKLEAIFGETTETVTLSGLYQWDYGQKLYIKGLNLPSTLEIHFSNKKVNEAIVMVATTEGEYTIVDIPNKLLEENKDIIAYIFYTHATEGKTLKKVVLKVEERTKPQDFISENPDASGLLEDVLNKINQNIKDNAQFKTDLEADQEQFQTEIKFGQEQFRSEIEAFLQDNNKLSVSSYLSEVEIDEIMKGTYIEQGGDEPSQSVTGEPIDLPTLNEIFK